MLEIHALLFPGSGGRTGSPVHLHEERGSRKLRPESHMLTEKLKDLYAGRSNKTITFIVHGFLNHFSYESMWNRTRDGFLQRGSDVITVDWSRGKSSSIPRRWLMSVSSALCWADWYARWGSATRATASASVWEPTCAERQDRG